MADYHPLISRAVAGLENNTSENRHVLYERARGALLNQLRSVDPPLEESDITRERLALEEAIRKVEADAVKPAPSQEESAALASDGASQNVPHETLQDTSPETPPSSPLVRKQGLQGWRTSMTEAENLGGVAAKARRSKREFFEAVPNAAAEEQRETAEPPSANETPSTSPRRPYQMAEGAPPPSYDELEEISLPPVRFWGRIVKLVLLIVVIAGLAGLGYWQRKPILTMLAQLHGTNAPKTQQAAVPPVHPKINDRVTPSKIAPKATTAPAVAVAQKVVLYEQDPSNPKGKQYVGSVIWRTETVSPGTGLAPELAVRADVDIPERHMRMTWSLRRNTDKAMTAASHTIEIQFALPANFDEGGIGNVPGVLMKTGEDTRGVPLAGLSVKVTDGYFLIGLSAAEVDKARNIDMLKNRDWMEIPIVYTNGRHAIMAIEKGPTGQRAFAEAFRSWGE